MVGHHYLRPGATQVRPWDGKKLVRLMALNAVWVRDPQDRLDDTVSLLSALSDAPRPVRVGLCASREFGSCRSGVRVGNEFASASKEHWYPLLPRRGSSHLRIMSFPELRSSSTHPPKISPAATRHDGGKRRRSWKRERGNGRFPLKIARGRRLLR